MRYRVEWIHTHPIWCEVEADNETEAIDKARRDERIPGTTDTEPGRDDWRKAKAKEL